MATRRCKCLCCTGPIEKDLICCFLATGIPKQFISFSPRSPPPLHAPWGLCKPLLLPVIAVCSCDAASSWVTLALHHTAPLWQNLNCKPVRPVPKGNCCPPLQEVCRGGTALNMGLQAIRPQNNLRLVPIKDICRFSSSSYSKGQM